MEDNKIIMKKAGQDNWFFVIIIVLVSVFVCVFQIMVGGQIKKANSDFIEGERVKNIVASEKLHKAQKEKALAEKRLLKQKEEDQENEMLYSLEEENKPKEESKLEKVENSMDYRQKLDIYRQSKQGQK